MLRRHPAVVVSPQYPRVFEGHRGTDRRPKILQYFIYAELCTYLKTMFLVRRS